MTDWKQPVFEPLVDAVLAGFLDRWDRVSVADVAAEVVQQFLALPTDVRIVALGEALMGATGARLERRTMMPRDLVNLSTDELGAIVATWSPEREREALELRAKRKPGRKLDA